ncbi:MAG: hypothetical protein ACPKPY_09130 [Nitrososphaeraceae archaeon]
MNSSNTNNNFQSEDEVEDTEKEYFQSNVKFTDDEIEFMITDLKDLLSKLQEKNVIDFNKEKEIMLLNEEGIKIQFKKTEIAELKRFISLVKRSFLLFNYLVRNLSHLIVTKEVERSDRIMGSINIQKTIATSLQYPKQKNVVVCNEIHKTFNTQENYLLTQILFSINILCNRYLSLQKSPDSNIKIDEPTKMDLQQIQNYAMDLLSSKMIKNILYPAINNISNYRLYLEVILEKILQGILPNYYIGLVNLLYKWKYFVWVSNNNPPMLEHSLRYYFFTLKNKDRANKLYECWTYYKILDHLSNLFNMKFKSNNIKSEVKFVASNGKIKDVIYQKSLDTGWTYTENQEIKSIKDKPDVVINLKNGKVIVIDAKHSNLNTSEFSYRRQMDSYMYSVGIEKTDCGIFLFSKGNKNSWQELKRKNQIMIWRSLTPTTDLHNELNDNVFQELTHIINNS